MQAITIISTPSGTSLPSSVSHISPLPNTPGSWLAPASGQLTADFIGRRLAFNITLLLSSVAGLVGAGSPSFVALATLCAFIGVGNRREPTGG